ncbi:MAG: hypothetical protein KZQ99_23065, partial [Candidatus Thiodiazotropha sp. (ex Dulcina madagascariensis)]|nr:hypothetical protein [Candidatus Thiodiazotropha sp. (ex Dulcina madagascariensis)]
KEYRQLLDMVFLADWVASAHLEDDSSPYETLREKIYAHAKDFAFDDLIVYDKGMEQHCETARFEEQGVMRLIMEYEADVMQRNGL